MKLVKTDEARVGQRAARDVTDLRGNLLFTAGTELTAELLDTCKQRTISHLFIEETGGPGGKSPTEIQAQKDSILKGIDHMFAGTETSAVMGALKEASKRYLTSKPGK